MLNQNQEILNTLEDKKFISTFQIKKIKDFIKETYDTEFKGFYEHYKDYYNHKKKLSYNSFVNLLIEYFINDIETKSFKVYDDFVINEIEKENRIYSFFDDLENQETDTLKNYDLDNENFNNFEYYDYDMIEEDFKQCFNLDDNEYKSLSFETANTHTYLNIMGFNILEDFKYYNNFKEFFEDLENLIYSVDLKTQIYHRFLLDNDLFNSYLNYDDKHLKKLDDDIKKKIKIILSIRLKDNKKDLRKSQAKLKALEKEFKAIRKPLIKDCVKVNIEKVVNHIIAIKKEIK